MTPEEKERNMARNEWLKFYRKCKSDAKFYSDDHMIHTQVRRNEDIMEKVNHFHETVMENYYRKDKEGRLILRPSLPVVMLTTRGLGNEDGTLPGFTVMLFMPLIFAGVIRVLRQIGGLVGVGGLDVWTLLPIMLLAAYRNRNRYKLVNKKELERYRNSSLIPLLSTEIYQ